MSELDTQAGLEAAAAALLQAEADMNATAKKAQEAAQAFVSAKSRLYAAAIACGAEQGE